MEIFMEDIAFSGTNLQITTEISKVIHGTAYEEFNKDGPVNFNVFLHRRRAFKRWNVSRSYRTGCITFPSETIGTRFLDDCQCGRISIGLASGGRPILCRKSNKQPRPEVLNRIRLTPFISPEVLAERIAMQEEFKNFSELSAVQFGWIAEMTHSRSSGNDVLLGQRTF